MELRDYQENLKNNIYQSWNGSARNVMAVLPTGAGKSVVISSIVNDEQHGVCVIAHRQELVSQMSMHLARDGIYHNIVSSNAVIRMIIQMHLAEYGKSFIYQNSGIAVAGVDTIIRRHEQLKNWLPKVRLWVVDEAHHLLADNKWGKAVDMFPNARGLGVTATPLRLDGKGLGRSTHGVMDDLIVGTDMKTLISRGYLTDYKIYAPAADLHLETIKTTASGEFNAKETETAIKSSSLVVHSDSKLTGDVVEHYLRIAKGKLGVTFVPSMPIGEEITAQYNAAGVPAMLVNAKTPDNERADIIKRFAAGELHQLVNVDLFGEGFDLPAIEVVSMARPTNSFGMYSQQFGRVLRLLKGKNYGIIIDHVGNVLRHGLPDSPRVWSLNPSVDTKNSKKREINPLKSCPTCALVYERFLSQCPSCGHKPQPVERNIEQVDGDLSELDPVMLARLRGDIVLRDRPIEELVEEYNAGLNTYIKPLHRKAALNKFRLKCLKNQEAQAQLRERMAQWAGYRRAEGDDDNTIFRKFYIEYGIDWLNAQMLEQQEANSLTGRIIYE